MGAFSLTVEGWKNDPVLSLREAAKKLNPINEFQVGRCNCKSGCKDQRCACRRRRLHIEVSSGCIML